jgi:hypothetical protein
MKVGFYGHVRQYHNLKAELDAVILEVLESGEYVLGPMLARFEKELAAHSKMKHAVGVTRSLRLPTPSLLLPKRFGLRAPRRFL